MKIYLNRSTACCLICLINIAPLLPLHAAPNKQVEKQNRKTKDLTSAHKMQTFDLKTLMHKKQFITRPQLEVGMNGEGIVSTVELARSVIV